MARILKPKPSHYTFHDSFPGFDDPRAFAAGDKLGYIIGFSGGVDSTIIIDMAVEHTQDPNLIYAFTMEMVPDLDYHMWWREYAWKRWQIRVHPYQHWAFSWYIRRGIFQLRGDPTYPRIVLADIERVVREDSGLRWIGYGYKALDSLQRRGMMNQWQYGIGWDRSVFAPLKEWNNRHTVEYLTKKRILPPITPEYASHGIDASPRCMHWLREYWPDDYERMLKAFPTAVAQADRWEAIQARKQPSGPRPPKGKGTFPDPAMSYDWKPKDQLDDLPPRPEPSGPAHKQKRKPKRPIAEAEKANEQE